MEPVSTASERDDRKSAALAARHFEADVEAEVVRQFALGRSVLRTVGMRQAGIGAEQIKVGNPDQMSVFFLDGDAHKRRRSAIARFFTPKAIATRYRPVMDRVTQRLIDDLVATGRARIDEISFELSVEVAAQIIGLTNSNQKAMGERIRRTLDAGGGTYRVGKLRAMLGFSVAAFHAVQFATFDVLPAVLARRRSRQDDVISHMLDERYSIKALLIECLTYGAAGMVTTREFITMAAWHLLEKDSLRAHFLASDEAGQVTLLEEILRLEPIAGLLQRRAGGDVDGRLCPGRLYAIDVRAANTDPAATGPCPHAIDPDRTEGMKGGAAGLSFGDGAHRCPGAQVALQESRLFLDQLLRVPGLRLAKAPEMRWRSDLMSYELRDMVVTCAAR
ncbi:cytochrome P450 [Devosia sp.]|uniref:cytochrome P450 n=1 Tax=Devosia sp. TaxID=1871048 RepID=UPI003A939E2D